MASRLARDGRRLALSDEPATRMAEGLPSESWWGVCDVREAGVVMGFVTPEGVAEDVAMLASHHVTSLIDQDLLVDSGDVAVSLMLRGEDMERCVCH